MIIRRILGPYLTPSSKRNLQKSLDISLRQGRVTLQALELDSQVINDKLYDIIGDTDKPFTIAINKVFVQELKISLFLVYDDDDDDDDDDGDNNNTKNRLENNDSQATRTKDSSYYGAKLVAKIDLDGVQINVEIDPSSHRATAATKFDEAQSHDTDKDNNISTMAATATTMSTVQDATPSTKGYLQSYVQAALDSLKLSLDINNVSVDFACTSSTPPTILSTLSQNLSPQKAWIKFQLKTISYKDTTLPPPPVMTSANHDTSKNIQETIIETKVLLGKEICMEQLILEVGSSTKCHEMLRYDGLATIITTIVSNKTRIVSLEQPPYTQENIQRHFEIALDDKLDINISPTIVKIFFDILQDHKTTSHNVGVEKNACTPDAETNFTERKYESYVDIDDKDDEDEQDLGLLSNIMQQQHIEFSQYMTTPTMIDNTIDRTPEYTPSTPVNDLFQTNEEGYSHYRNVMSSSSSLHEERDSVNPSQRGDPSVMNTIVCFYLAEMHINTEIQVEKSRHSQMVSMNMVDLNLIVYLPSQNQGLEIKSDIKDLRIEHVFKCDDETEQSQNIKKSCIVQFINVSTNTIMVFVYSLSNNFNSSCIQFTFFL